jgi:heptosyltransferase III
MGIISTKIDPKMTLTSNSPQRFLIIKLRHYGDVLLTTPVIRLLRAAYPEARIDLLVYEETVPILEANEEISQIWTLPSKKNRKKGIASLFSLLKLWWNLFQVRYNTILHLSDQLAIAWLSLLLAASRRIGIDFAHRHSPLWKRSFTTLVKELPQQHIILQNIEVLSPLLPPDFFQEQKELYSPYMPVSPKLFSELQKRWQHLSLNQPYIILHAPARWRFKCWEEDRMAAVAQFLAEKGWQVLLTSASSPEEIAQVTCIKKLAPHPGVISLAGELSLQELAALMAKARLFIGVDSFPMHLAAAFQVETIALFGPSKINQWSPWNSKAHLINAHSFGELIDPDEVQTNTKDRYLQNIPQEVVIELLNKILPETPNQSTSPTSSTTPLEKSFS